MADRTRGNAFRGKVRLGEHGDVLFIGNGVQRDFLSRKGHEVIPVGVERRIGKRRARLVGQRGEIASAFRKGIGLDLAALL